MDEGEELSDGGNIIHREEHGLAVRGRGGVQHAGLGRVAEGRHEEVGDEDDLDAGLGQAAAGDLGEVLVQLRLQEQLGRDVGRGGAGGEDVEEGGQEDEEELVAAGGRRQRVQVERLAHVVPACCVRRHGGDADD